MVGFLPFKGYRPNLRAGEHIGDRISPPYDVISDEYLAELQSMEFNVTNLTLKQDGDKRYHGARNTLDSWIESGALKQDEPSFYIYEQTFDDNGNERVRKGIVGVLKTESYDEGNIMPHEETFSKVKADRLNLLRDMEAHLESIFGIYQGFTPELNRKINDNARLVCRYVDSANVEHKYYKLSDESITSEITEQMKSQKMLIADGHHRYETALNYSLENPDDPLKGYVLATLVAADDSGLVIWPTHRLVNSGDISEKNAIKGISKAMDVTEVTQEEMEAGLGDHLMGLMFRSGKCFFADYKGEENTLWTLDTYVAQEKILKGVYKSDEGKAEVSFDAELPSVKQKMSDGKHDLAIILNDPSLQTIWDLAGVGKRMPKKTTFFFPKIWSGFVFYLMR